MKKSIYVTLDLRRPLRRGRGFVWTRVNINTKTKTEAAFKVSDMRLGEISVIHDGVQYRCTSIGSTVSISYAHFSINLQGSPVTSHVAPPGWETLYTL